MNPPVLRSVPAIALFSMLSLPPLPATDPPPAERRPHRLSVHGVEWTDDYFWLREREGPAVRAYLDAENAYL